MADCMMFPDTVEEYMEKCKIVDTEQVYTNGAKLVPIFRMKQWFEHEPEQKKGKCVWCDSPFRIEYYWIDREGCTASFQDEERHLVATGIANYCPNCGADMMNERRR